MTDMNGNEIEYRPLTREEQLEWQVKFLESQLAEIQKLLDSTKLELLAVKQEKLDTLLERREEPRKSK